MSEFHAELWSLRRPAAMVPYGRIPCGAAVASPKDRHRYLVRSKADGKILLQYPQGSGCSAGWAVKEAQVIGEVEGIEKLSNEQIVAQI